MAPSQGLRSGGGAAIAAAISIALVALIASGCNQETKAPLEAVVGEPPRSVSEVLQRMIDAYHQAERYQDQGRLLVRYKHHGEIVSEAREFSLALAAPNRIRMRAYDALVVCDGRTVRASIDEAPDEVLSFAAPEELSPETIYGDPVLGNALNQIVGSVPLSLFLDPEPLPGLLLNAHAPRLDPPGKIGADECYRVRIERREGAIVLWIDTRTFVLRRVEYPPAGYVRLIEPYRGPIEDMTITAELDGARLDAPIDDATFRFDVPRGAELVKQFEAGRPGARIPRFKLRSLDGRTITRESLADKIAVIKFWQKNDVFTYYHDLSSFDQVRRKYQDQDGVVFLAVSPDLDEVSDDELRAALAEAELSLPIARATRRVALRSFGLQMVPTTVILGRDGRLQEHVVGVYPDQTTTLSQKLDTLLAGGDLSLEAPKESPNYLLFEALIWQKNREFADDATGVLLDLPRAAIAPESEPEFLRRMRLWECSELRQPGNILVVPGDSTDQRDRVFVIEGLPSVAEIGAAGKIVMKHRLELPDRDDSAVKFLRSAADAAGNRYFVGSKTGVQQLHLFDAGWKRLLSYPEAGDHPGISDALLADLNGDGQLEIAVGYFEAVGVHCLALDGHRLWRNRVAENVLGLAVTEPDNRGRRQLLVAQGQVLPIDAAGREQPPISLPGDFLRLIFTADLDGNGEFEWCAIAMKPLKSGSAGPNSAVGLSPAGALWSYDLPDGMHRYADFEMVVAGNLLGGSVGQWVIGGADGSIHILGIDGSLIDRFNLGTAPRGMAVANLDGRPALLVSTDEGLEAWHFEVPSPDQAARE